MKNTFVAVDIALPAMEGEPNDSSPASPELVCRVCLCAGHVITGLRDNNPDPLIRPCPCDGSLKWIHFQCAAREIAHRQNAKTLTDRVRCRVCDSFYVVLFMQHMGLATTSRLATRPQAIVLMFGMAIWMLAVAALVTHYRNWDDVVTGALVVLFCIGAFIGCCGPLLLVRLLTAQLRTLQRLAIYDRYKCVFAEFDIFMEGDPGSQEPTRLRGPPHYVSAT